MKISLDAGASLPVCDITTGRGGSWSKNGTIIFSPNSTSGIFKVPSSGGQPQEIIKLDSTTKALSLRWEYFLPDGDHFLYSTQNSASGSSPTDGIFLSSLSDIKSKKIIDASSNCQYADGYLLFVRQGILLAQKFDPDKLEIEGEAMPVAENIQYYDIRISGTFSVSQNGKLVYLNENQQNETTVILDKSGREIKRLFDQRPMYYIDFSPDGEKLAYDFYDHNDKNIDIWTYDLTRNVSTRLTFSKQADIFPIFTQNGKNLLFASNPNANVFIPFIKNTDGTGEAKPLVKTDFPASAVDISPDENFILLQAFNPKYPLRGWDILLLNRRKNKKLLDLLAKNYNEQSAKFSPNMKWIAYMSNESGKYQIYIIPFDPKNLNSETGGKWQISVDGGRFPKWMNNGKAVYYFTPDNKIMGVNVNERGPTMSPGKPYIVFDPGSTNVTRIYDINNKGTEIIATVPNGQKIGSALTLVANWQKGLEEKK